MRRTFVAVVCLAGCSMIAKTPGFSTSTSSGTPGSSSSASSVPKQSTISSQCVQNAWGRVKSVTENYYPGFQKSGAANTIVWFARKDLEAARHYLVPDPENKVGWYSAFGQTCYPGDKEFAEFKQIEDDFAKAEGEVKEMEAAKGVTFREIQNGNHVVYIDSAGKEVPNPSQI
jgi:hypothetical protein